MADMGLYSAGLSAIGSLAQGWATAGIASAQAAASKRITAANNKATAAINSRNEVLTGIQRWQQQVRNKRVLTKVENDQESSEVNYQRQMDMRTQQGFAMNIKAAEQSGRQQAAAAASGVTGSVVDVIDGTSVLRQHIAQKAFDTTNSQLSYDHQRQQTSQRLADLDQMDYSIILDNNVLQDYTQTVQQRTSVLPGFTAKDAIALGKGLADFSFSGSSGSSDSLDAFLTLNDNFSSVQVGDN